LALVFLVIGSAAAGVISPAPEELVLGGLHKLMNEDELNRIFGVNHESKTDDYQVIYIRQHRRAKRFNVDDLKVDTLEKRNAIDDRAHYSFAANGKEYTLMPRLNNFLIAPSMKTVVHSNDAKRETIDHVPAAECHFLHVDEDLVAAFSHCSDNEIHGYLLDGGKALEIRPLTPRLRKLLPEYSEDNKKEEILLVAAHILRPADPIPDSLNDNAGYPGNATERLTVEKRKSKPKSKSLEKSKSKPKSKVLESGAKTNLITKSDDVKSQVQSKSVGKILELAIFVDEAAVKLFMPYLGLKDYAKLRELVLAFVNGMQALYHLSSLGTRIELSIVYMEFHAKQPSTLATHGGERGQLLNSFCQYQSKLNTPSDKDAEHWDMALYLSGLDFWAKDSRGKPSYVTMGLATVTGVCTNIYNCVIGEFGVVNRYGQPYPSTGFTSVFVMAHEIAHNLGLSHDSSGNSCTAEGYIMSPSRGLRGESEWSTCSASQLSYRLTTAEVNCLDDFPSGSFPDYNHNKYGDKPGQMWNADDQCRILLRDRHAYMHYTSAASLEEACYSMTCKTPNRDGYFYSGPALSGTSCGSSKWCSGGACVHHGRTGRDMDLAGGWSQWTDQPCKSGCLDQAKGVIASYRDCDSPAPFNVMKRCVGERSKQVLCDDDALCPLRTTADNYAKNQCQEFSHIVDTIDPSGVGIQAAYSASRPWQSCAIFCKRKDLEVFYTPRLDLNNLPDLNPFYPDGTWCGNDGTMDYYCMQRNCIAQGERAGKAMEDDVITGSIIEILNNAPHSDDGPRPLPHPLQEYFMMDSNGNPVKEEVDLNSLKDMESSYALDGYEDIDFITLTP